LKLGRQDADQIFDRIERLDDWIGQRRRRDVVDVDREPSPRLCPECRLVAGLRVAMQQPPRVCAVDPGHGFAANNKPMRVAGEPVERGGQIVETVDAYFFDAEMLLGPVVIFFDFAGLAVDAESLCRVLAVNRMQDDQRFHSPAALLD
jgi:hypothetical protein